MKGDFSRRTYDRQRHFRSVRMQRGRVQLDADWNEELDLQLARLETMAADLVGAAGAPTGPGPGGVPQDAPGLRIFLSGGKPVAKAGRLYAGGLLCELEADTPLDAQTDLPGYGLPTTGGRYLAYLDAWEEHVTALDDPDLAEPTLGGADTATRSRVVAQVKLAPVSGGATPALFPPGWSPAGDPAPPPVALAARSAGAPLDNQLFRVEIHRGGGLGGATFKWSRDNGVAVAAVVTVAGNDLTLAAPPSPSPEKLFAAGQWVEVTSRAAGLRGEPGVLVRLLRVQGGVLTVEGWPGGTAPAGVDRVRRWDSPGEVPVAVPAGNDGYLPLADGVEVRFAGAADAVVATGDHWLIPSRAAAGVLWPVGAGGEPAARPPEGIRHRYAPLALLDLAAGAWSLTPGGDCRRPFDPAILLPAIDKVSRAGDKMTGALTIQSDLFVTGQVHAGGEAAPPAGVKLKVSAGALRVRQNSGLAFPSLAGSTASLRHEGTGLTVEVTGASDDSESLRLFQNGADRMVFADGRVGIGVAEPAVSLDVGGLLRTQDLEVGNSLTLVDGSQGAGLVLTLDNTGNARWRQVPKPTVIKPVFFDTPIPIASGTDSQTTVTYRFAQNGNPLTPGTTAVILEAEAAAGGPDNGAMDSYIRVRQDNAPGTPWLIVLRGRCAGDEDSAAWAGQAVCPVAAVGNDFQIIYSVQAFAGDPDNNPTGPAFDGGWSLSAVGYFL